VRIRKIGLALAVASPVLARPEPRAAQDTPGQPGTRILTPPCPQADARFGQSLVVLQMDGVGDPDLAVGAWGEDCVYVYYGAGNPPGEEAYELVRIFDVTGPKQCPITPAGLGFGYDVAGGNLDDDPADELVVGAPFVPTGGLERAGAAYLFAGTTGSTPIPIYPGSPHEDAEFGTSVATGDFDGDDERDIAVSAIGEPVAGLRAGAVHVFFGPFDSAPPELVLENPFPVADGSFGLHLAVADGDGNGVDDLYVSAVGNTAGGIVHAGQVFAYPGPIDPSSLIVIEDPAQDPNDLPAPRFGMHIEAREDLLLVGANRKDWLGVHDAGMGFSARGPALAPVNLHPHPHARPSDYMGFRCVVADVVGDASLDVSYIVMASQGVPNANWRAILTWDGDDLLGPPAAHRRTLPSTSHHFGNGSAWLPASGGKEAIVLGDPTFDRPGEPAHEHAGRVVIYYY